MRREALEKLKGIHRPWKIREALAEMCREFGEIVRIEIEPDGTGAYICLVDMATVGQNAALVRGMGGFAYGLGVGFRIPIVPED